ncbi:MAG: VWA domain-containing protein [Acidobacteriota bacterium]
MRRTQTILMILALIFAAAFAAANGQQPPAEGVYIIFDGSGSMWGQLPDKSHKIEAARRALKEFLAGDFAGQELALRVYGHRRKGDCADTELIVPFSAPAAAAARMQAFVDQVNPRGKTPISRSLRAALEDFGDRPGEIILITDGMETCGEDPCLLVREWMEKDVKLRVHVVGLGLDKQEKEAMQCIAQAAGTEYQDAGSASQLAAGLANIQRSTQGTVLLIRAKTSNGERMAVKGSLRRSGGEPLRVASQRRNKAAPGEYELQVGVETRNGNLYKPVSRTVRVPERGETVVEVVVAEPPSLQAKFMEGGKEARGSLITAYQDGKEVFRFRWNDRVYVDPGTYEFQAKPNRENDLRVIGTVADGERKVIRFEMAHTVRARIKMVASGSGLDFRQNYELWQGGKKKYAVHWGNGVLALPGTYDLRLPDALTPYLHQGLVLTDEDVQEFRIEVPVGHVTVRYQDADGSAIKDERCWLVRLDGERRAGRKFKRSGQKIPLRPGKYQLEGWKRLGDFDLASFEIAVGDDKEVVLRCKR